MYFWGEIKLNPEKNQTNTNCQPCLLDIGNVCIKEGCPRNFLRRENNIQQVTMSLEGIVHPDSFDPVLSGWIK